MQRQNPGRKCYALGSYALKRLRVCFRPRLCAYYLLFIQHLVECSVQSYSAALRRYINHVANGLETQGFAPALPRLQRRFAASPVYTCFAGDPFVGRGVEGCEAPAPVNEEARVIFSLWSVFIGNFVLYGVVMKCCQDGGMEWVDLPACRADRHRLTKDLGANKLVAVRG